jgi:hypothetical protein
MRPEGGVLSKLVKDFKGSAVMVYEVPQGMSSRAMPISPEPLKYCLNNVLN